MRFSSGEKKTNNKKKTKNKQTKLCLLQHAQKRNGSVGRDYYYYLFFFFNSKLKCICLVVIMLEKRDFIAIITISRFELGCLCCFCCLFSTFHIKVQLFCFLLKQFFENVKKKKKKVYGGGGGGG